MLKRWRTWVTLALLVVLNFVAWDWASSSNRSELALVLHQESSVRDLGFSRVASQRYYGLAPGIRLSSMAASVVVSFFVGEILPFLLAARAFQRRQPPALPLPPVTGAPR